MMWIDVNKQLPQKDKWVLIWQRTGVLVGSMTVDAHDGEKWGLWENGEDVKPNYWRELPSAPELEHMEEAFNERIMQSVWDEWQWFQTTKTYRFVQWCKKQRRVWILRKLLLQNVWKNLKHFRRPKAGWPDAGYEWSWQYPQQLPDRESAMRKLLGEYYKDGK